MKKETKIILSASLCLCIGVGVAYYNTSSLGYDNANILSFNSEEVNIFDFTIKYTDAKDKIEQFKENTPKSFITI